MVTQVAEPIFIEGVAPLYTRFCAGLARLWQITKQKLRVWPFPY